MYSREIDGEVLTLAASGWTYDYTFVLYDRETESLWYQLDDEKLTCIDGFYKGRTLPIVSFVQTSWASWHADHPDSLYLAN